MPRSPLTESIQKVRRLVTEIQGTLTVDEFNLLLDELVPEPEPEVKQAKKTRKKSSKSSQSETERVFKRCDTCGLTKRADVHKDSELGGYHEFVEKKSPCASGMAAQLNKSLKQQRETAKDTAIENPCEHCGMAADMPVHDKNGGYVTWHPFVPYAAPPAPVPSPANGEATNGTVSSETEKDAVSNAVRAGG